MKSRKVTYSNQTREKLSNKYSESSYSAQLDKVGVKKYGKMNKELNYEIKGSKLILKK